MLGFAKLIMLLIVGYFDLCCCFVQLLLLRVYDVAYSLHVYLYIAFRSFRDPNVISALLLSGKVYRCISYID